MIKYFLFAVIVVLASLGLAELLHTLLMALIAPRKKMNSFLVVCLSPEDAESELKYIASQVKWYGRSIAEYRIAAYGALTPQQQEHCKKIAEAHDIIYCPAELTGHVIGSVSRIDGM